MYLEGDNSESGKVLVPNAVMCAGLLTGLVVGAPMHKLYHNAALGVDGAFRILLKDIVAFRLI